MEKITLKAKARKEVGRKVKLLRKEGILPANIYGKKIKSESIQITLPDFREVYKKAGETGLIYIEVEGNKEAKPVLVANIQRDPVSDATLHIDFHQVDLKEKIGAKVPVELTGESPAEKQSIGTVVQYLSEVEVEALPTDLPEKFVVDISALIEVDQSLFVKDIKVDKSKVEIKTDIESILVKVEPPQKEEVVVAPAPAEGEVPVEGTVPAAEGEVAGGAPQETKEESKKE